MLHGVGLLMCTEIKIQVRMSMGTREYNMVQEDTRQCSFFVFEFPCIIRLYYIKNQQDATLAVLFISHCEITLHVSDAFCVHHQEY